MYIITITAALILMCFAIAMALLGAVTSRNVEQARIGRELRSADKSGLGENGDE